MNYHTITIIALERIARFLVATFLFHTRYANVKNAISATQELWVGTHE